MPRHALATASQDEAPAKREGLKLAQIASYDDLLTDALVDRVYFWTRIRKNRSRYSASRNIREEDVTNILRQSVIVEKDAAKACTQLLDLPGLKQPYGKLSKDDQGHFQRHLRKYVDMYLPDCPFEVSTTNRYTIDTHEAATTARKPIRKGELIKYLVGIQVPITSEDEKTYDISRQDFSIVMSSRKRTQSLFLGPARFSNHDCDANAKLTTRGSHSMTVVAARDIGIGEEITVSYGGDYFGIDNCECLCATCEGFGRNGWDPTLTQDSSEDEDGVDEEPAPRNNNSQRPRGRRVPPDFTKSRLPPDLLMRMQSCEDSKCQILKHRKIVRAHCSLVKEARNSILQLRASRTSMIENGLKSTTLEPQQLESKILIDLEEEGKQLETDLGRLALNLAELDTEIASIKAGATAAEDSVTPRTPQRTTNNTEQSTSITPRNLPQHPRLEELRNTPLKGFQSSLNQNIQPGENSSNATETPRTNSRGRSASSSPSADRSQLNSRVSTPATSLSEVALPDIEEPYQRASGSSIDVPNVTPEIQTPATTRLTRSSLARSPHNIQSSSIKVGTDSDAEYSGDPTSRRPGDYTLTRRLLGTPYSRWVECRVCDEYYVQTDSYHLRWSCPRCERHSKLYGYQWPKTDKLGKHDIEERVLDHRTVNRFVAPEEVKSIKRGRRTVPIVLDSESQDLQPEPTEAAGRNGGKQMPTYKSPRGQKRRQDDLDESKDEQMHRPSKRGRRTVASTSYNSPAEQQSSPYRLRNRMEAKTGSILSDTASRPQNKVTNKQSNKQVQTRNAKLPAEVKVVRTKRQYVRSGKYASRRKGHLLSMRKSPASEFEGHRGDDSTTIESSPRRVSLRVRRNTLKLLDADERIPKGRFQHTGRGEDTFEPKTNVELQSSRLGPGSHRRPPLDSDEVSHTLKNCTESETAPELGTKFVLSGKHVGRYTPSTRDPFIVPWDDSRKGNGESEHIFQHRSAREPLEKSGDLNSGSQPGVPLGSRIRRASTKLQDRHTLQTEISHFRHRAGSDMKSAALLESSDSESDGENRIAPATRARDKPNPQSVQGIIKSANTRRFDRLIGNNAVGIGDRDDNQTIANSTRHRSRGMSVLELLASADRRRLDYIADRSGNDRIVPTMAGKLTTPSTSKRLKKALNSV